jgi:two-component system, cell cycle response regulator
MDQTAAPRPRWVLAVFAALFVWLAAYELHAILAPHAGVHTIFTKDVHLIVLLAASALILARVVMRKEDRLAWTLIGLGVLAWSLGEVYYTFALWDLPSIPIPSAADGGYLAFPVLAFAGICVLARAQVRRAASTLWTDGLAAALAVGSVSAAIVLDQVLAHAQGRSLEVITNLAYPVTDLVLLGSCITVIALRGWRLDRTWLLVAGGVVVFWIADSLYLVETALGTYTPGGVFDIGWWLGLVLIALAAWQPTRRDQPRGEVEESAWMIALPIAFGALAAAVLVYGSLRVRPLNPGAVGLALAALAAGGVRLVITFRASLALLRTVRAESLTDALTGMPNRRALTRALEAHTSAGAGVLALYDLDGFKHYNDAFGHQAGDALLIRLGHGLTAAVDGHGVAYRMGGDEFCVLVQGELEPCFAALAAASAALSEHGEGFVVTSSCGAVVLPDEAATPEAALRIADQRMYTQKQGGRPSASRQSTDVLLRALAERYPELDDHSHGVAELAAQVARCLTLSDQEIERVRLAAELHDVGKVAIPEAILNKPGSLDDDEWVYIRRHSVIGERILSAAPSLHRVAQIVRASHERVDGTGYPDHLTGPEIPLGARIIAVCDAYDAMTTERPYSKPMPTDAAIAELRRCAGSQFDPNVVEAFCAALAQSGRPVPSHG